jgi:hypothetical protein
VVPPHNHQYMMVQSANALFFRVKMRQAINGAFSAILLTVNLPAVAPGRPKWLESYSAKKPNPCVSGEFLKKSTFVRTNLTLSMGMWTCR